jgi:hypothetical protein
LRHLQNGRLIIDDHDVNIFHKYFISMLLVP